MASTTTSAEQLSFQRADDAYRAQRYREAETLWRGLVNHPQLGVEAQYSAGMCLFQMREFDRAAKDLSETVLRKPTHAHALYQLGCICAIKKNFPAARNYLREALRIDPSFRRATEKLAVVDQEAPLPPPAPETADGDGLLNALMEGTTPPPSATAPNSASISIGEPGVGVYGAYEVLQTADDLPSRNILKLLDNTQLLRRPRTSAFLDRLLLQLVIGAMLAYVVLQGFQLLTYWFGDAADPVLPLTATVVLLGAVIVAAAVLWELLVIRTTVYRIERGRVQAATGVFLRRWRSVELFRVIDAQLDRSLPQLLTGDATLVVVTSSGETRMVGLGTAQEMGDLASRLLTVAFYLRTSSMVRGIII